MNDRGNIYRMGIDAGSTTLKVAVLDTDGNIAHKSYVRHKANISGALKRELAGMGKKFAGSGFAVSVTGSAGMGISERTGIPFVQEVVASVKVAAERYAEASTLIDLGGEDAKMVFFGEGRHPDIRMNGSCAGGTGSFIDQMADLMNVPVEELDALARGHKKIYPVASRCGVFAKTDVQNLIGRGVSHSDLAMSILHTVALQSITSLARGCDIKPKILCVGGPLTFIPSLRDAFRELLKLDDGDILLPDNGEYFPAWGAALETSPDAETIPAEALAGLAGNLAKAAGEREDALDPLFGSRDEYEQWLRARKIKPLKKAPLGRLRELDCYLGVDSGSTTTKVVVLDADGNMVYSFYEGNEGNPLKKAIEGISGFCEAAAREGVAFRFAASAATGYGEDLVKTALGLDYGIVETMAHLSGAQYADPEVSFVLDIGGQDMKSVFTRNGVISNIELNEACSSGCGSFLQNFASAMNLTLGEFTEAACASRAPADLGSRCTVFMNSKVKQSLRENAAPGDIAAGLAYSVVKNCLFKVLKISNLNRLGDHIVVQGGTFRNDAVYRALELLSGKSVSSTDSPELMGALGAALYARRMAGVEWNRTAFTGAGPLPDVTSIEHKELQCKGCANRCNVLRFRFPNGNTAYSGNKCEKVFCNSASAPRKGYNAFEYKNGVLFDMPQPRPPADGKKMVIGIPRVLNMFENYPFWHTLFTECGFGVELSPESTFPLYRRGVSYVMSDNICFPAKVVHGHILALADKGVDRIFYPIVPKDEKELRGTINSYNCPVVSGYPDVVRSSMDPGEKYGVPFDKPVITFDDNRALERGCAAYLAKLGVRGAVFKKAFAKALAVREEKKRELADRQKEMLDRAVADGEPAFIVAGRPYHADPLINQKVGQILSDLGVHAFTDDVFRRRDGAGFGALRIVSQWAYPNRVVQAAMEVARLPRNVQMIQLNSFGCGPDSFFMDETGEILRGAGKTHTLLRIDEIASPGSIRLRLRSLIESLRAAESGGTPAVQYKAYSAAYTKEDNRKTILTPWFSDFISPFIPALGELAGYRMVNLPRSNRQTVETGLRYGHNEVCYPSTLVLGDIITALQSGAHDPENTVVAITQTGGQCRATNYISQIKNGLQSAGFGKIPVIVLSSGKVYQNEQKAFRLPLMKIINVTVHALLYADSLQQMYGSTIVREKNAGDTQSLFDLYIGRGIEAVRSNDPQMLMGLLSKAVADFNAVPIHDRELTKVGLLGEIYVKYNDYGQVHTTEWLRSKGVEVVTPPILDFVMQYFVNTRVNRENGVRKIKPAARWLRPVFWKYMNDRISRVENIMKDFRFHMPGESIFAKAEYASEILDLSNQFGEGWSLAAEVAHYARHGVNNIVCVQPFGCIANHIVAKGIEKRIKKFYPDVNLLYLDVDGGMAEVNLQNRLHFLIRQGARR